MRWGRQQMPIAGGGSCRYGMGRWGGGYGRRGGAAPWGRGRGGCTNQRVEVNNGNEERPTSIQSLRNRSTRQGIHRTTGVVWYRWGSRLCQNGRICHGVLSGVRVCSRGNTMRGSTRPSRHRVTTDRLTEMARCYERLQEVASSADAAAMSGVCLRYRYAYAAATFRRLRDYFRADDAMIYYVTLRCHADCFIFIFC